MTDVPDALYKEAADQAIKVMRFVGSDWKFSEVLEKILLKIGAVNVRLLKECCFTKLKLITYNKR